MLRNGTGYSQEQGGRLTFDRLILCKQMLRNGTGYSQEQGGRLTFDRLILCNRCYIMVQVTAKNRVVG